MGPEMREKLAVRLLTEGNRICPQWWGLVWSVHRGIVAASATSEEENEQ